MVLRQPWEYRTAALFIPDPPQARGPIFMGHKRFLAHGNKPLMIQIDTNARRQKKSRWPPGRRASLMLPLSRVDEHFLPLPTDRSMTAIMTRSITTTLCVTLSARAAMSASARPPALPPGVRSASITITMWVRLASPPGLSPRRGGLSTNPLTSPALSNFWLTGCTTTRAGWRCRGHRRSGWFRPGQTRGALSAARRMRRRGALSMESRRFIRPDWRPSCRSSSAPHKRSCSRWEISIACGG